MFWHSVGNYLKFLTSLYLLLCKTLVGFIPDAFFLVLSHEKLKTFATLNSLFTYFSSSKRAILFFDVIPLFVKRGIMVFGKLLIVIITLDVILEIYPFMLFFVVFTIPNLSLLDVLYLYL